MTTTSNTTATAVLHYYNHCTRTAIMCYDIERFVVWGTLSVWLGQKWRNVETDLWPRKIRWAGRSPSGTPQACAQGGVRCDHIPGIISKYVTEVTLPLFIRVVQRRSHTTILLLSSLCPKIGHSSEDATHWYCGARTNLCVFLLTGRFLACFCDRGG